MNIIQLKISSKLTSKYKVKYDLKSIKEIKIRNKNIFEAKLASD
jgi:hypothetical protein